MPLPVLPSPSRTTDADLLRAFVHTEREWTRHFGEETVLEMGLAFASGQLSQVWDANCVLEAALPVGVSPQQAVQQVEAHFTDAGSSCRSWTLNPAAPVEATAPLREYLVSLGWWPDGLDVMHLDHANRPTGEEDQTGLQIIPARAGYRHTEVLLQQAADEGNFFQSAQAQMLHLDDPDYDPLIGLKDGKAVAMAGVLTVGELGRLDQVYVAPAFRRRGIGRLIVGQVLEGCARALLKHILLGVRPDNVAAVSLFRQLGFRKVGELTILRSPECQPVGDNSK